MTNPVLEAMLKRKSIRTYTAEMPGGIMIGYVLNTTQVPGFIESNHVPLFGGLFGASTDAEVSDTSGGFSTLSGVFNIGAVLPTGLDLSGLQSFLSLAVYTGSLGTGTRNFELFVIPEPSSFALTIAAAVGLLAFARRRRKN